jgi:hypothetical protein
MARAEQGPVPSKVAAEERAFGDDEEHLGELDRRMFQELSPRLTYILRSL